MSQERSIFEPQEGFAIDSTPKSPFSAGAGASPFTPAQEKSPFATPSGSGTPAASPFTAAKEATPFAQASPSLGTSPFSKAEPASAPVAEEAQQSGSPFKIAPDSNPAQGAPMGSESAPMPFSTPAQAAPREQQVQPQTPFSIPSAPASAPAAAPQSSESSSAPIRQLELRAIFGVDRELSENEILERARSLRGIRNLIRVSEAGSQAFATIRQLFNGLNFGSGDLKLYQGNSPIDFIQEGGVTLAVQTDGSFAPGVRETLIIIARELSRM